MTTHVNGLATATSFAHTSSPYFQAWAIAVSNALTAIGLTKTSDPQPNLSVASKPSGFTYAPREFRRFTDPAQSQYPISMAIDYGTGSTSSYPAMRIYAGTGTDGSGGIVGYGAVSATAVGGFFSSATTQIYACHAPGIVWVACISLATDASWSWAAVRSQDQAGAHTGNWSILQIGGLTWPAMTTSIACINRTSQAYLLSTDTFPAIYPGQGSGPGNGRIVSPLICAYPDIQACDAILTYRANEFSPYTTFTASPLGVERTYMALPIGTSSTKRFAMAWE